MKRRNLRHLAFSFVSVLAIAALTACGGSSTSTTSSSNNSTSGSSSSNSSSGSSSSTSGSSSSNSGSSSSSSSKKPIIIGISNAQSGDFAGDGKAILNGYKLWAHDVNASGGLFDGRPVELKVLNSDSSTKQTTTNYTTLISTDHVDLILGPFSSLLTIPAEQVAHRYHYLLIGPAGGAPSVFQFKYPEYIDGAPATVDSALTPFASYVDNLPKGQRPTTAAYMTSKDPFTFPQLVLIRPMLEKAGIKTVLNQQYPDETPNLQPEALAVVHSKADLAIIGTTSVPQAQAFIQAFIQQHYNPKALIFTSGPDQGSQFSKAIGVKNTAGIMVPESWTPTANTYQNAQFVKEYTSTYGVSAANIPADAPEAYTAGQELQAFVKKAGSINNAALIQAAHSGMTVNTVQGPIHWNSIGEPQGKWWLVQWQNGKTQIVSPSNLATSKLTYPKPNWP